MGCNDFKLVLDSSDGGDKTPIEYNIYLDGVGGTNGYSPTINFVNQTDKSFQIQVNDINGTTLSDTIPLFSYIDDLDTTYLKVDGSNAANIVNMNNIRLITANSTTERILSLNEKGLRISGHPLQLDGETYASNAHPNRIRISEYGNDITLGNINRANIIIDNTSARYNGYEIATLNDIQDIDVTNKLDIDGSNADSNFTINGVKLTDNSIYINSTPYSYINVTQENPNIYYNLGVERNRAFLSMPSFVINSYPYPNGSTYINTTSDFYINTQGAKFYYGSSTVDDNEVATKGDIPSIMTGTDGSTDGTAGLVPAPLTTDANKYLRADGTWGTPSGSGGGGTSDYSELTNKPQINSVTLDGNKTSSDLGLATATQGALAETAVQPSDISDMATQTWVSNQGYLVSSDLDDYVTGATLTTTLSNYVLSSSLATVATTGNYSDLINKPVIPSLIGYATEQWVQNQGYITGITGSDVVTALGYTPYNSSNPNGYTSNIGTVTSVNNAQPDSNGNVSITIPDVSNFVTNSSLTVALQDYVLSTDLSTTLTNYVTNSDLNTTLADYQPLLESGVNIKTINNQSILGSGNIEIQGGEGVTYTSGTGIDITNNVISIDNTVVTTDTTQTISGYKTFTNQIRVSNSNGILNNGAYQGFVRRDPSVNQTFNEALLSVDTNNTNITVGSQYTTINLLGRDTRPNYNGSPIALLSDVSSGGAVDSVNGQTGSVVLTASDVGALPDTTIIPTNADYVDLSTAQEVGGVKTFTSSPIIWDGINIVPNFVGVSYINAQFGDNYYRMITRDSSAITLGNSSQRSVISGSTTRPYYNNTSTELALLSDVPTTDQTYNASSTNPQSGTAVAEALATDKLSILEALYPVGSIYIGTMAACPLQTLGVGIWELKSSGRVLQGADANHAVGTTIEAGLPNITGTFRYDVWADERTGAFTQAISSVRRAGTMEDINAQSGKTNFNASLSNAIYGNSETVQPPAYVVNIWERIV